MKSKFQDAEYLRNDQYRNSENLNARASLHQRFSTNPQDWHQWVFDQLGLAPGLQVLECGCGPGWLWRKNLANIPDGCSFVLSDLSSGMVAESRAALAETSHDFRFIEANIESLPFDDDSFDVVVANHMLYHVHDRRSALAEVRRVMRRSGRFYAATIGEAHMGELWELGRELFPGAATEELLRAEQNLASSAFGLENGRAQLESWFTDVELHLYEDNLVITKVEPLIAYISSSIRASRMLTEETNSKIRNRVQEAIADQGAFYITKSQGLFVARNATKA